MRSNIDIQQPIDNSPIQSTTISNVNANGNDENAFLTDPPIIDDDEEELRRNQHFGPEMYKPGELPRPRFVMLGQQGVGKVSFEDISPLKVELFLSPTIDD